MPDSLLRSFKKSGPWIRTTLRDSFWLENQLNIRKLDSLVSEEKVAEKIERRRAFDLSRAIFSALRSEHRPTRIHAGTLSKLVNISMNQAQNTISNTPSLQLVIAAVNAGKDRRLAAWAARELVSAGKQPTSQEVLVHAGLNTTKVNRQFAIAAIESFAIHCR